MGEAAPTTSETGGRKDYRYHQPFLPEYITTIAISLAANWIVVAVSEADALAVEGNPHVYGAVAAYTAVIFTLVGLTFYHRFRFCTVTVADTGLMRTFLGFTLSSVPFAEIDSVEERRDGFFGRRARVLALRTRSLEEVEIADFVHDYEDFKQKVIEGAGKAPINEEPLSEPEYERLRKAAAERDTVFGAPGPRTIKKRLSFRALGLMPVVCVELVGALLVIYEVFGQGPEGGPNPLSVYAGAVTLAISGVVARFTYYYIFSTHWAERQ